MHTPRRKGAPQDVRLGTAYISPQGELLSADACFCDLLGATDEELRGKAFDSVFRLLEPEEESSLRARLLNGEIPYYSFQRDAVRNNGEVFRVRIVFALGGNDSHSLLAIVEDLTELRSAEAALEEAEIARRELARRLTTAQEEERNRIARELHDDIGQSLAILRIQMLRAGQPVSGMAGKWHPTIPELCNALKGLTDKVSSISHQLHSAELEYVGLASAIESQCREFSQQYKVAVECSCEDIPNDMDGLLAVNILRIVQEALHNAGKHSRAKSLQVAVHGSPSELSLLIADDGIGFDLEQANLAAGLGLISMRERVHLADGEFKITSQPGEGTCIAARIPLSSLSDSSCESVEKA
jgi:PAS domain S-box-containing protein